MGNFYTNITLRSTAYDQLVELLHAQGFTAYLSPLVNDCIVLYPQATENQDTTLLQSFAAQCSAALGCAALAVLNHDDDLFTYWLFSAGRLIDSYDSTPGYFEDFDEDPVDLFDELENPDVGNEPIGGDATRLCAAFGAPQAAAEVEGVLRARQSWDEDTGYIFAIDRHADLADLIGLPDCSVGFGYSYLDAGETPEDISPEDLLHISGG